MAALSALRNRNNQKLREGFEDFLARCMEKSEGKNEIDKIFVLESLEKLDVKMDSREKDKLQRISNDKNKINKYITTSRFEDLSIYIIYVYFREDFVQFAKSSKAIKAMVEKQAKVSSRPGTPVRSRSRKNLKIDKALAAFKVQSFEWVLCAVQVLEGIIIKIYVMFIWGPGLWQQWILGQGRISKLRQ